MTGIQYQSDQLCIDGVSIEQCASEFGTPLFIYGGDSIKENVGKILESIGDSVQVYYSIKANPNIAIAKLICMSGVHGVEIASDGELEAALRSGFIPDQILFAGPGKTDQELGHAIRVGVGQINAESIGEIKRISQKAQEHGRVQRVGVRVNLEASDAGHGLIKTSGGTQKFGVDESKVADAVEMIQSSSNIKWAGLHTMLGSQVLDESSLLESCRSAIAMAVRIGEQVGEPIETLNLGGGLGVSHKEDDPDFDIELFGNKLNELIESSRSSQWLADTQYMIEPGRALVSAQGVYVTSVVDTKDSGGQSVAVVDGGIHHALLPITANTYQILKANRHKAEEADSGLRAVHIGGPLCTSADQWRSQVELAGVEVGDLLVMLNSGAYGLSASMIMFLSKGTPSEVLVLKGNSHLIRERSGMDDHFRLQHLPFELQ